MPGIYSARYTGIYFTIINMVRICNVWKTLCSHINLSLSHCTMAVEQGDGANKDILYTSNNSLLLTFNIMVSVRVSKSVPSL